MTGPEAANVILDNVIAFGHKRRVKLVRPTPDAIERARQERRQARADLRQAMESFPRTARVERIHQDRGAAVWAPQPTNARSGQVGGLRRVTMPGR